METQTFANPTVLEFYKELPFNYQDSVENQVKTIKGRNSVVNYPILPPLLGKGISVLEVGCGTGWFSNGICFYYQSNVTGIDFNPVAIERCKAVAKGLKINVDFQVADLFLYQPEPLFDVVVSLGVLHHTDNCQAAVKRIFAEFVKPGGHVMIGLYHQYGRQPFLDHFQAMKERGASEEEMLARYQEIHPLKDKTHLVSWFRDQVLHPHETQHTLGEMVPILEETGMELVSTSINRFQPIDTVDKLLEEEKTYQEIARQRLQANQYFPGFFIFLAKKI
jgi:2-polyprenyl-3-methyl-5-hydroxy-6-metoxy-1,4-benzoquinol methylase